MNAEAKVSVKKDGKVYVGDKHIGSVESYECSRTGYRRGLCIGQVKCTRWWAYDAADKRIPSGRFNMGVACGWDRRADAVDALTKHAASAETDPQEVAGRG